MACRVGVPKTEIQYICGIKSFMVEEGIRLKCLKILFTGVIMKKS